jgi:hypothetical protein
MERQLLTALRKAIHERFDDCEVYTKLNPVEHCEMLIIKGDKLGQNFNLMIAIDPHKIWNLQYSDNYGEAVDVFLDELFAVSAPQLLRSTVKQLN